MAAPDWVSYIAAATGVAGAVMGLVSLLRSYKIKSLDLRLELRRLDVDYESRLTGLLGLIPYAKNSRAAVNSATGRAGSPGAAQWMAIADMQFEKINAEFSALPKAPLNYVDFDDSDLEAMLVARYGRLAEIGDLREKYKAALDADDAERARLGKLPYVVIPK